MGSNRCAAFITRVHCCRTAKHNFPMNKSIVLLSLAASLPFCALQISQAQITVPYTTVTNTPPVYGPYNGVFLPDGEGLNKKLIDNDTVLLPDSPWTLYAWVN